MRDDERKPGKPPATDGGRADASESTPSGAPTPSSKAAKAPASKQSRENDDDAPRVPEVPSPTMPKGGGAVRGLGETFEVNPANGTFGAGIPLPAAGARGLAPSLGLQYNSGSGNSPFGEGWSLPIGSISRKSDLTLPRYHDQDVFLAGGEDFVSSTWPNGGVWTNGARDAGDYAVQCYRPRVEAAFERFERWTRKSDGDVHWRARGTDGQTSVYGQSPSARVADPAEPTRVFRWLLERTYDDRGDVVTYVYRAEDRLNVAPVIWERGRSPVYVHIDRVLWGVRAPYDPAQPASTTPSDYLFELVFDYGERDAIAPGGQPPYAPPSTWLGRDDPFSSFKAGFEVRCYRLCKRVLLFHRVDAGGVTPTLVRELSLRYDGDRSLAKLIGATMRGWRAGASIAFPEVVYGYTTAQVDPTVHQIAIADAENLPAPLDGKRSQWIDLDGEGIPGVLIEDRPGWYYKRNLGGGALAPVETLPTRPTLERTPGGMLLDLAGDGTKSLVRFDAPAPGLFARGEDFDWEPFAPFTSIPSVSVEDANARFIDLDGDGRADVLVTEDRVLRWYPSLGYEGFGAAELVLKPSDEANGPALVFADAEQALYLADMSGDGLTDLVRIRNGEVCYWPNLGYGKFGAKITMGNAPRFGSTSELRRASLRLADVDGSGTADLLYCEGDRVRYWLNLAGNSFAAEQQIDGLPYDSTATVEAIDLLGNGTSCLVWTSPLPSHARRPLRYIELTGGIKPHLMQSIDNGLGRAVSVAYAASTSFYLADRAAGRPWITRVPFPVQAVASITTTDQIAGSQLSTQYSYHHGFYDGYEREFRGFGMVEQTDTETLAALESRGAFPAGVEYVPPARTRTWFHTGAFLEGEQLIARYRQEWFSLDPDQARLDDGVLPAAQDAQDAREALRALRGRALRVELYADEQPATAATPIPYQVTEHNYQVRPLQPRGANRHAVFAADALESLVYAYERDASDPRVEHDVVLEVGLYGAITQQVHVAYPRRGTSGGVIATYGEHDEMARDLEAELYRVNVVSETRLSEVAGLAAPAASPFVFARADLQPVPAAAAIAYDQAPSPPPTMTRRLLRRTQIVYYGDDDTTPLAVGAFGKRALLRSAEHAVAPASMLAALMPPAVDAAMLGAAGYALHDGHWWAPSSAASYSAAAFFQATSFTDPFNNVSTVTFDAFQLFPVKVTNALQQSVSAVYDYVALQPSSVIDVNGNSTLAAYDALGWVSDVAESGKNGEGDTLGAPTVHYDYTLDDWKTLGVPNHSHITQRLIYGASRFAESFIYSDGFGRELSTKVQADPGPALQVQGASVVTVQTSDRWIASGRTVYDNKGNPVRKYEPYYAVGPAYDPSAQLAFLGVTPVLHYDPVGRQRRTDLPDGTFSTVTLSAWQEIEADGADNCAEENELWVNRAGQSAADQRATAASLLHRRTPTVHDLDQLGRRVTTTIDNTQQGAAADVPPASHVRYRLQRVLDVRGLTLQLFDDRGLNATPPYAIQSQTFDMLARPLQQIGADTGTAYTLADCQSKPLYTRDARGVERRFSYDVLRRPTQAVAHDPARALTFVAEKTVYGDDPSAPVDASANLLGRVYQNFDQAGIVTSARYDFMGNLLTIDRQLTPAWQSPVDWSQTYLTPFVTTMEYDALRRVVRTTLPRRDSSRGTDNVIAREFLVQGLPSKVTVTTQFAAAVDVISAIEYDAKGRRVSADYGNGAQRTFTYDPLTFRLTSMTSIRNGTQMLQSIVYTYDAVGNVTEITDTAQPIVFNNNQQINPQQTYTYDSIYRLTDASGREMHDPVQPDGGELAFGAWSPDGNDLVNYTEHYDYDSVGNLQRMVHRANNNTQNWTRQYGYDLQSNRLTGTSLPGAPDPSVLGAAYGYDAAGNMISMPHLASIGWDERGQMASADQTGGGVVYCRYDFAGNRSRKIQTRNADSGPVVSHERIYVGDYEVYRVLDAGGNATSEIESVHGLDESMRVVLFETQTSDAAPAPVARYQLENQLGSAMFELDEHAALLSYEEYHPFGSTAYHAGAAIAEVGLKRYRFLGKERDAETGLDALSKRYYASWLGRFISADPAGLADGPNLYAYSHNNPVGRKDPSGTTSVAANVQKLADMARDAIALAQKATDLQESIAASKEELETAQKALSKGATRAGVGAESGTFEGAAEHLKHVAQAKIEEIEISLRLDKKALAALKEKIAARYESLLMKESDIEVQHFLKEEGASDEVLLGARKVGEKARGALDRAGKKVLGASIDANNAISDIARLNIVKGPPRGGGPPPPPPAAPPPPKPPAPPGAPPAGAAPEGAPPPGEPPAGGGKPPPGEPPGEPPVGGAPRGASKLTKYGGAALRGVQVGYLGYRLVSGGPKGLSEAVIDEPLAFITLDLPVGIYRFLRAGAFGPGAAQQIERSKPGCAKTDSCPNMFMGRR